MARAISEDTWRARVAGAMRALVRAVAGGFTIAFTLLAYAGPAHAQTLRAHFAYFDYRGSDPTDLLPVGQGQYRNPILPGFYPDPSIERVGEDYYLVNSSFGYFPGLPVFHSRDLVHWEQIGNAIDRPGQLKFEGIDLSRGLYAPAITYHDGTFFIVNTCVTCGGNFVMTAARAEGPWSQPVWLREIDGDDGYDPSLFFDEDGRSWIVSNGPAPGKPRYDGHRAIWLQRFDARAMRMIGPRTAIVDSGVHPEQNPQWIEGPHLFKRFGYYYLSAAEGGTGEGHSQVIFRSRTIAGPYEAYAKNPILTQRDLPPGRVNPVTSAGHADMVETQNGEWWAVFLATRPYGDNLYNTGRETFLLPIKWVGEWPVILDRGKSIPAVLDKPRLPRKALTAPGGFCCAHQRTSFAGKELPRDWVMMRTPSTRWWTTGAGLTLEARAVQLGDQANPSYVAHRQQHRDIHVETKMRFAPSRDGDKAGLAIVQSDHFYYFFGIVRAGGRTELHVERRASPLDPKTGVIVKKAALPGGVSRPILLGLDTRADKISFRYAIRPGGAWRTFLAGADNQILSTKIAGGFVGSSVGVYAARAPTN